MRALTRLLIVVSIGVELAACARLEAPVPTVDGAGLSQKTSLVSVPFHPQTMRDDCGPAALAMMLGWSGIDTDPVTLAPSVYTPGREGTLQADIVQASRRAGRLAIPVRSLQDLLIELDAGNPVLVLQNLGLKRWPAWHYAVAIGYDLESRTLFLHSGRTARFATSFVDFEASWQFSERWALTVTRPEQLPVTVDRTEGLAAVNGLEQAGSHDAAARAYGALLDRWPDSLAALMGFGNARYASGDISTARKAFRQAVTRHPEAAEAWNNLAVSLGDEGRYDAAIEAAEEAVRLSGPNEAAARQTLRELQAAVD